MSDDLYQFDIVNGRVVAVREWDDGRWKNESIDNDDVFTLEDNRIIQTDRDDGDVTIYENRGDGTYIEVVDRDDRTDDLDDRDDRDDDLYQFDIVNGRVVAVREWDDGRWENESIDNDDVFALEGNRIIHTDRDDGDVTIYENRGDGTYIEVVDRDDRTDDLDDREDRDDDLYQFDIVNGRVVAVREWDDGRWENESIDNGVVFTLEDNRIIQTDRDDGDVTIYENRGDGTYIEVVDRDDRDDDLDDREDFLSNDEQLSLVYSAAFDRAPDQEGLNYWRDQMQNNDDIDFDDVVESFMASDEFTARYGRNLSDNDFVEALYSNTLERASDIEGKNYWLNQLAHDGDRDDVLEAFALSDEHIELILTGQNSLDDVII